MPARAICIALTLLLIPHHAAANFEGWYQIEVIIFANQTTTDTDEVWPLTEKRYPHQMVSIEPDSAEEIRPATLGQMEVLESYLNLWDGSTPPTSQSSDSDFLFESRRNIITPMPVVELPEEVDDSEGEQLEPEIDYDALFTGESPIAFKNLPRQEKLMNSIARSLNRSSMYEVLLHQSWLQPVVSEAQATPILIQAGKRFDSTYELEGTMTLSRARFLHIETDLWFTEFTPITEDAPANILAMSPLDGRLAISRDLRDRYPEVADWMSNRGQYIPVHSHHLDQSRRMRSATMHFLDHPKFGLLIRTERFEPETEE